MSQEENQKTDPNDNIIPMPVKNMKKHLYREYLAEKRNALFASALGFLAVFGFVNHILWQSGEESSLSGGRGIASAGSRMQRTYDKDFEQQMLSLLKESTEVRFARQPDSLEQFQYGELAGQYQVKMKEGKLFAIELSQAISKVNAEYKRSSLDFLFAHSERLAVKYSRVDKISEHTADGVVSAVYSLKHQGQEVAKAHFEHNADGGAMLSFRLEP